MEIKATENHDIYLQRMAQSANKSTKELLPSYFSGKKRILDVGCADGVMLEKLREVCPQAELVGLDLCHESAEKARNKGFTVHEQTIEEYAKEHIDDKFDGILFSSVLHEISSYADEDRYTEFPIISALKAAKEMMSDDGIVVIRDGVQDSNPEKEISFKFKKPEDIKWIEMFTNSRVGKLYCGELFTKLNYQDSIWITCLTGILREFLFKYTWGEDSWERESNEVVGILPKDMWEDIVTGLGFTITRQYASSEQYAQYLEPKIELWNGEKIEDIFKGAMMTMVLKK